MTADATLHTRLLARIAEYEHDSDGSEWLAAALRAVGELHAPAIDQPQLCRYCWEPRDEDYAPYPCPDIRLIADQLGLTEGTDRG